VRSGQQLYAHVYGSERVKRAESLGPGTGTIPLSRHQEQLLNNCVLFVPLSCGKNYLNTVFWKCVIKLLKSSLSVSNVLLVHSYV